MSEPFRLTVGLALGCGLIFASLYNQISWKRMLSSADRAKCYGTVVGFHKRLRKGPDATGYVYRLRVKYKTEAGQEIVSISQNTVLPKAHFVGESVEIAYLIDAPQFFHICDDQNQRALDRLLFVCGLFLCALATAFIMLPSLFLAS